MSVAFVFTNPKHHLEMMAPVARVLVDRGVDARLISLAEVRGVDTPKAAGVERAIPFNLRRRLEEPESSGQTQGSSKASWRTGGLAKRVVWAVLGQRMKRLLRGAKVIVVPNDAVYPYIELLADARRRGARTVLMQEGIRFPLPNGYDGPIYGGSGNAAVCAWGEGSRDYFLASKVDRAAIRVTGAPRLDGLDPAAWRDKGQALLDARRLARAPVAFLSNPIEIQGYGSKAEKLALFERFLAEAAPVLRAGETPLLVKTHTHEDPDDFARIAAGSAIADLVCVLDRDAPIFAAIAASRAAVVLTSTVGLEALAFGLPLGQLEIPGHDFAFEYVARGAAVALRAGTIAAGLGEMLAADPARRAAGAAFVERHLHDRGRARDNVATVIEAVLAESA
jgi:hypothetical protein